MATRIWLKEFKRVTENGCPISYASYAFTHSTPGRDGTTLEGGVVLRQIQDGPYEATLDFGDEAPRGQTPAEALKKLGAWCARAAEALKGKEDGSYGPRDLPVGEWSR